MIDQYHAREHYWNVANLFFGKDKKGRKGWAEKRRAAPPPFPNLRWGQPDGSYSSDAFRLSSDCRNERGWLILDTLTKRGRA